MHDLFKDTANSAKLLATKPKTITWTHAVPEVIANLTTSFSNFICC